jgi:hypothetical protein
VTEIGIVMSISLVFTGALVTVVEKGIGTDRERDFNARRSRVVENGNVLSICLTLTLVCVRVVDVGIVVAIERVLRACLFAVTEKGIGNGMVRAFVLAKSRVVVVGIVSSICLGFIVFLSSVVKNGITASNCRNEYLIRSRVTEIGMLPLKNRETRFWINGMMSRILRIEGKPYQGKTAHLALRTKCGRPRNGELIACYQKTGSSSKVSDLCHLLTYASERLIPESGC